MLNNPQLSKFQGKAQWGPLFDLSSATLQEKLELLEALIKEVGEGNTYIVVTNQDGLDRIAHNVDMGGADILA